MRTGLVETLADFVFERRGDLMEERAPVRRGCRIADYTADGGKRVREALSLDVLQRFAGSPAGNAELRGNGRLRGQRSPGFSSPDRMRRSRAALILR